MTIRFPLGEHYDDRSSKNFVVTGVLFISLHCGCATLPVTTIFFDSEQNS